MCGRLPILRQEIKAYATAFQPEALDAAQAAEVVSHCSAIEASISAVKALAGARLAESGTWKGEGYRSAAEQLAAASGVSSGAARGTLDTGRRLAGQQEVAGAALRGELSPAQTALVANGTEADPDKAADLIHKARNASLPELADEVARVKAAAADLEERRRAVRAARRLRGWTDLEGIWHLVAQGLPEDGARLHTLLATVRRALVVDRRQRGIAGQSFDALDYDSLVALVQIALGTSSELTLADLHRQGLFPDLDDMADDFDRTGKPASDGPLPPNDPVARSDRLPLDDLAARQDASGGANDPTGPPEGAESAGRSGPTDPVGPTGPRGGAEPAGPPDETPRSHGKRSRRRRGALTTQVQVRVDLDTLLRGVPVDGELCEIVGHGPVPVSVIEDLLANDNVFVVAALVKSKRVVGVHHWGRHPTAYQKSALSFFDPTCAAQGCNAKAFLQNDHREDWAKTHFTVYDLMDRLCSFHHRLKTTRGWALVLGAGKRPFVPPDDPRHPGKSGATIASRR